MAYSLSEFTSCLWYLINDVILMKLTQNLQSKRVNGYSPLIFLNMRYYEQK